MFHRLESLKNEKYTERKFKKITWLKGTEKLKENKNKCQWLWVISNNWHW